MDSSHQVNQAQQRLQAGLDAYGLGDYAEAKTHLEEAAGQNNVEAMYRLGRLYYFDSGFHDPRRSFEWFLRAAEAGHGAARFFTGQALVTGAGTERNIPSGVKWLEGCSHMIDAKIRLCEVYSGFRGKEHANPEKAFAHALEIYARHQEKPYSGVFGKLALTALAPLAYCYEHGIGTAPDPARAVEILKGAENEAQACD